MRLLATSLSLFLLTMLSIGCQDGYASIQTPTAPPSASPTPQIGVDFVTVTPGPSVTPVLDNAPTVSRITPTATATITPRVYTVQAGDTLVDIAAANGILLGELLALNPDVQPELLSVGQQLFLPPLPTAEAPINDDPSSNSDVQIDNLEIVGPVTYNSATGSTWILGEVRNGDQQAVELVQVEVTLSEPDGTTLASERLWVTPFTLPAGEKAPFGVLLQDRGASRSQATAIPVSGRRVVDLGNRYLDLAVENVEVTIGRSPIEVAGDLHNIGQQMASQVAIITTFYDDHGMITGFHELTLQEVLPPGESTSFNFVALPPGGRADEYEFVTQAFVAD